MNHARLPTAEVRDGYVGVMNRTPTERKPGHTQARDSAARISGATSMALVQPAADRPALRASPRKSIGRRLRQSFWGYFFIAPSLLMFLLFSLYPMIDSVIL